MSVYILLLSRLRSQMNNRIALHVRGRQPSDNVIPSLHRRVFRNLPAVRQTRNLSIEVGVGEERD